MIEWSVPHPSIEITIGHLCLVNTDNGANASRCQPKLQNCVSHLSKIDNLASYWVIHTQPVSQPNTQHCTQEVLAAMPWLLQNPSKKSATIGEHILAILLKHFMFTWLPAMAGMPRRPHSDTNWASIVWRGTTIMTVEPETGGTTGQCPPNYHKVPTFGHLPSGMRRPSRIIGRLFPYPVGRAHIRCPSSLTSSAIASMSTCNTTSCDSKPSGCCTGNLEITELTGKFRVGEP